MSTFWEDPPGDDVGEGWDEMCWWPTQYIKELPTSKIHRYHKVTDITVADCGYVHADDEC